jgi:thioredoxin-like negative regulator of GroEL
MKRIALLLSATFLLACHPKITPAPPPLRPKAKGPLHPADPPSNDPTDCQPAKDTMTALTYKEREAGISMAEDLASRAGKSLESAKKADQPTHEELTKSAVDDLVTALKADPYNVDATYELAGVYVDIDRFQCAINLLNRLVEMKDHPSRKTEVAKKFDKLIGRGSAQMDPAFDKIRQDDRFLELLKHL